MEKINVVFWTDGCCSCGLSFKKNILFFPLPFSVNFENSPIISLCRSLAFSSAKEIKFDYFKYKLIFFSCT